MMEVITNRYAFAPFRLLYSDLVLDSRWKHSFIDANLPWLLAQRSRLYEHYRVPTGHTEGP